LSSRPFWSDAGCSSWRFARSLRRVAESAPSHRRLLILRIAPIARLLIWIAGIIIIVPLLVEPTFEDIVALVAAVSLALAFGLRITSAA